MPPYQIATGLTVRPLHPLIGAELHGVDLSAPVDGRTLLAIHQAWLRHMLLVFPDQRITDAEQITFARQFGDLEIHPAREHRSSLHPEIFRVSNVDEEGNIIPSDGNAWGYINITWLWHSDSSFREVPSKGSILHGIEVAAEGGRTMFCNLYAVYEALPAELKQRIHGRRAIHSHDAVLANNEKLKRGDQYEDLRAVHPLVRRHPDTGRQFLFLSPHTMSGIEGMPDAEARALLDELARFATQEQFVYAHAWRKDDVILWDNRCTMHAVMPYDNKTVRRIMHRTTLIGESPVLAA
jgi:alpha-ketoglutarate-dependent taurine dioxygenase